MPQVANIVDKQLLEVPIAAPGPNDPNRMFICTGKLQINFWVSESNGQAVEKTFTALIQPDPPLAARQFHRAVATASVAKFQIGDYQPPASDSFQIGVEEAQADLDDETHQAELRVTVTAMTTGPGTQVSILEVAFQVTILARI